jgi:hypothetical protein
MLRTECCEPLRRRKADGGEESKKTLQPKLKACQSKLQLTASVFQAIIEMVQS